MRTRIIFFFFLLFATFLIFSDNFRDPFSLPNTTLKTMSTHIHYANADLLSKFLNDKNNKLLSPQGHALSDKRTNILWVEDSANALLKIKKYVSAMDVPIRQIFLKAKVMMMDQQSLVEIGSAFSEKNEETQTSPSPGIIIPIINLAQENILNITLTALEEKGHIHTLAEPELVTSDRQTAEIESGAEIPYQEKTGQGNTSISFKKAVLSLKVTPIILSDDKILLRLLISENKPSALFVQGVPSITTQQLKTEVIMNNRQTLILGGIHQQTENISDTGVPLLNRIPLIGKIFSHRYHQHSTKKLMILITPRIL